MVSARPRFFSWYVAKLFSREILGSFVLGTAIFLFIMLMFQAIRLSEFLVVHQAPFHEIVKMSVSLLLSFIPIAVPVAFLFSVLMGVSRANSEGEILALQVSGFSPARVFAPLFLFSLFVAAGCAYLSMYLVPRANRSFELRIGRIDSERVMANIKPGVFIHGFYGLTMFCEEVNTSHHKMKRVFIYDNRESTSPLTITAQEGRLEEYGDRGGRTLRLRDGFIFVERPWSDGNQQVISFEVYDINLEMGDASPYWRDYSAPSFTFPQLKKRIAELSGDPLTVRRLQIELHRRLSISVSIIVFALMGFAMGCRSQRGVRSGAIVLCLLVGVFYWLAFLASTALSVTGWAVPQIGIWIPNVLLAAFGAYLFRAQYR